MLFQAVIKYWSSSKFFKILSKRLKVHCRNNGKNFFNDMKGAKRFVKEKAAKIFSKNLHIFAYENEKLVVVEVT